MYMDNKIKDLVDAYRQMESIDHRIEVIEQERQNLAEEFNTHSRQAHIIETAISAEGLFGKPIAGIPELQNCGPEYLCCISMSSGEPPVLRVLKWVGDSLIQAGLRTSAYNKPVYTFHWHIPLTEPLRKDLGEPRNAE